MTKEIGRAASEDKTGDYPVELAHQCDLLDFNDLLNGGCCSRIGKQVDKIVGMRPLASSKPVAPRVPPPLTAAIYRLIKNYC